MNNELINYYNNLFIGQITSFSIIIPVIFVFLQLTSKEYTTFQLINAIKSYKFIIYFIFAIIIMISTGFSGFLLTIKQYDFIKFINFYTYPLITSNAFAFSLLLVFVLNFIPIILFVRDNLKQLNPGIFIESYLTKLDVSKLELYLYKNYGLPYIDYSYLSTSKIVIENEYQQKLKQHEQDIKRNDKIQRTIDNSYEPVFGIIVNILNYNLTHLYTNDFTYSINSFINSYEGLFNKLKNLQDKNLSKKLIFEYCNILLLIFESSMNINYRPFSAEIISSLKQLIQYHNKTEENDLSVSIFEYFEKFVDVMAERHRQEVSDIFEIYLKEGINLLGSKIDENTIENLLRTFARFSEKVIIKYNIEKQPIMMVTNNENIFNNIFECLYRFYENYSEFHYEKYPLLLLDANYCIFNGFLEKLTEAKDKDNLLFKYFSEHSALFFYEPRKLCIKMMDANNARGACLCINRLIELFDLLLEHNKFEIFNQNIETLIFLGFYESSKGLNFKCDFMYNGISNYILSKIQEYQNQISKSKIDGIVFELFITSQSNGVDIRKAKNFLFSLGTIFQSNFNLNFDWMQKKWNNE
jgi:hypothetical protein